MTGADFANMQQLIEAYDEYVAALDSENGSLIGLAYAHGWRCPPERVQRGEELRAKIAALKEKIGHQQNGYKK